jgi:transcriptional regulator with XRE-family HTH domain
MIIGDRIRELREAKNLSQGDIENRTGLLRCYLSRVENGHTVPCIDTLKKIAHAMQVPLYQLFYDGDGPPKSLDLPKSSASGERAWGSSGKDAKMLGQFRRVLSRTGERDLKILLSMAQKMSDRA